MESAQHPETASPSTPLGAMGEEARRAEETTPPGSAGELLNWTSTLSVVFLSGATLNSGMRYCARGDAWDAAGTVLSGVLGYVVYRLTVSDKMLPGVMARWVASILPILIWALLLPILMYGLGFSG